MGKEVEKNEEESLFLFHTIGEERQQKEDPLNVYCKEGSIVNAIEY